MSLLERARGLHRDPRRSRNLWWTEHVSYRIGSLVAAALFDTSISPNMVTLASLLLHVTGAAFVLLVPGEVNLAGAILVFMIWQAAYGLDCADGQLARARNRPSPFGAWLDQVVDQVGHAVVFTALSAYFARELGLSSTMGTALTGFLVGGQAMAGAAAGLKPLLIGRRGAVRGQGGGSSIAAAAHLADYGLVLALASCLLPLPAAGLVVTLAATTLAVGAVGAQVAIEWRRAALTDAP